MVLPEDPEFDCARQVFNSAVDRFPAAVLYCRSDSDVQMAVRAARESGRKVVVRSTGHSVSGRSVADDAIVVDLSEMRHVDSLGGGLFACEGGATWRDFDMVSSTEGYAVAGGTVSTTGVGGLTLGGGIGWLLPSVGLACDSLIGADVVMADGEKRYLNDRIDAEVMRSLRGLGHGLGIATRLYFKAHPLAELVGGSIVFDLDRRSRDTALHVCELMSKPPKSLMLSPSFLYKDSRPVMSIDLVFAGAGASELALLERIENSSKIVYSSVRARSYMSVQSMLDAPSRRGLRSRWQHTYLHAVESEQFDIIADLLSRAPSSQSIIFFEHYHGAYVKPPLASAFPNRDARFSLLATASWSRTADDGANFSWLNRINEAMRPWQSLHSGYINYASELEAAAWRRYDIDVRRRLDPDGVFVDPRPPCVGGSAQSGVWR